MDRKFLEELHYMLLHDKRRLEAISEVCRRSRDRSSAEGLRFALPFLVFLRKVARRLANEHQPSVQKSEQRKFNFDRRMTKHMSDRTTKRKYQDEHVTHSLNC
ncbi:unnamed protein product [Soboliphyme baturini]|uniref:NPH3 domain-containing protein n=1 Tax=Soboliphyme baturini TaxID=241478 RepID=A0A183IBS2_9BILA|nr:unnamed protein product [Soboliphyme baturini]